jgi:hypothetical protein
MSEQQDQRGYEDDELADVMTMMRDGGGESGSRRGEAYFPARQDSAAQEAGVSILVGSYIRRLVLCGFCGNDGTSRPSRQLSKLRA